MGQQGVVVAGRDHERALVGGNLADQRRRKGIRTHPARGNQLPLVGGLGCTPIPICRSRVCLAGISVVIAPGPGGERGEQVLGFLVGQALWHQGNRVRDGSSGSIGQGERPAAEVVGDLPQLRHGLGSGPHRILGGGTRCRGVVEAGIRRGMPGQSELVVERASQPPDHEVMRLGSRGGCRVPHRAGAKVGMSPPGRNRTRPGGHGFAPERADIRRLPVLRDARGIPRGRRRVTNRPGRLPMGRLRRHGSGRLGRNRGDGSPRVMEGSRRISQVPGVFLVPGPGCARIRTRGQGRFPQGHYGATGGFTDGSRRANGIRGSRGEGRQWRERRRPVGSRRAGRCRGPRCRQHGGWPGG